MNYTKHIAAKAYEIYMKNGSCQLSPDDALWYADQYLDNHTLTDLEDAIQTVSNQLIQEY
jgi:hypothetical protein